MRITTTATALLALCLSHDALSQVNYPPAAPAAKIPGVILGDETPVAIMRRQRVVRQPTVAQLRAQPKISFAAARLDMAPVLNNPAATINMARRLRALPQHVQVNTEKTIVSEIDRGLVVHSLVNYRILTGRCRDPQVRAQLAAAGAPCFSAQPPRVHMLSFSDPRTPRYVADPSQRARAVADYQERLRQSQAHNNSRIAQFRRALADPQQRSTAIARLGAAEVERLSRLSDDQLKEEAINSATIEIEEVMFIPKDESLARLTRIPAMRIASSRSQTLAQTKPHLFEARRLNTPPATRFVPPQDQKIHEFTRSENLGTAVFLTGFTLGRDYEWRKRVSITINFCVFFDCAETYYLEPYAGFNYGFGLRFPIQTAGTYDFKWNVTGKQSEAASVKFDFVPVNGTPEQYAAAGLPQDRIFRGQEFVAEAGVYAGLKLRVPLFSANPNFSVGVDFTEHLPPPFTHGQFTPPSPGTPGLEAPFIFDQPDLIGGLANYGVAGAKVLPAIKVRLFSESLRFTLHDYVRNADTVVESGRAYPVGITSDPTSASKFDLRNPVYNLGFRVTPGIDARIFVDIEVWSNHWDWPVWFPQIEVELPPGGIDFACHDDTRCTQPSPPFNPMGHPDALSQSGRDTMKAFVRTPPSTTPGSALIRNQPGTVTGQVPGPQRMETQQPPATTETRPRLSAAVLARPRAGTVEAGTNRAGSDYRSFPAPDATACQAACTGETQCKAWTWDGTTGRCWLKNNIPPATANSCCTSGRK